MPPTPPPAPVTTTGPSPGFTPCPSSAMTASMAVNPAVPSAMAWRKDRPSGRLTSHSGATCACSARPPQCFSPTPQPVSSTGAPARKAGLSLERTVPAKSMPGTKGNSRTIRPLPVIASASL